MFIVTFLVDGERAVQLSGTTDGTTTDVEINDMNLGRNMESNERTPLLSIMVRIEEPGPRRQLSVGRRFLSVGLGLSLFGVVLFVLLVSRKSRNVDRPVEIDTQTCYSSLNTSKAYASAEALYNNIGDFCQHVGNNVPYSSFGWTRSKTYYQNTPEEYTMTVIVANLVFSSDGHRCIDAMTSIIDGCDVSDGGTNPMNWKQGGQHVHGEYTYQIDISRQNRPWPPPAKPRQRCEGWYKFFFQHYDIYGAGWANHDWGEKSLMQAINPCCGLGTSKSKSKKMQNRLFSPLVRVLERDQF